MKHALKTTAIPTVNAKKRCRTVKNIHVETSEAEKKSFIVFVLQGFLCSVKSIHWSYILT